MTGSFLRLGDVIDDYCPRCKLLLNHAAASIVDGKVVKVVCQTCHSEHPYKNAEVPPKKKSGPKAALLDQVLAKVAPAAPEPATPDASPEPVEVAEPRKKKRAAVPARYISRYATRPPRGGRR
jgi:DNA-directed RNA polymerase subunit M/transcription elongation factor TFIIS